MALKLFKGKIDPQCAYCEFAEIAQGSSVVVCKKIGGVMQLHSKCKKYRYDPLKRQPKSVSLMAEYTKEDFQI